MVGGGGGLLERAKGRAPQWYFEGILATQGIFDQRTRSGAGGDVALLIDGRPWWRGGNEEFKSSTAGSRLYQIILVNCLKPTNKFFFPSRYIFLFLSYLLFFLHVAFNGLSSVKKKILFCRM